MALKSEGFINLALSLAFRWCQRYEWLSPDILVYAYPYVFTYITHIFVLLTKCRLHNSCPTGSNGKVSATRGGRGWWKMLTILSNRHVWSKCHKVQSNFSCSWEHNFCRRRATWRPMKVSNIWEREREMLCCKCWCQFRQEMRVIYSFIYIMRLNYAYHSLRGDGGGFL